jgi:hypothetical protein
MTGRERVLYFGAALLAAFVVAFLIGRAVAPALDLAPGSERHGHSAAQVPR